MSIFRKRFTRNPGDLVLRDDQADFSALLDAAKDRRAHRARLRLIDAGRLTGSELERLGLSGAEIYTSDAARLAPVDFFTMIAATKKGGGLFAYFHHGPLAAAPETATLPFETVLEMARSGAFLYFSNKSMERETEALTVLTKEAHRGRGRLIYYHHGSVLEGLEDLARSGAWIHFLSDAAADDQTVPRLGDLAKAAAAAGAGVVFHVERLIPVPKLEDLMAAGAHFLFRTPPSDYRSPYRSLEARASRRRLDPRACYLYCEFMR
jgi:hypothetical protein